MFNTPVPLAPGPKARPNAIREGDTIKALGETRGVLSRLVALLAPYRPQFLTDVKGNNFEVLAREVGRRARNFPFDIVQWIRNTPSTDTPWQSSVRVVKYGETTGTIERYGALTSTEDDVGLWAYFGVSSDWNFKSVAKSDKATSTLFDAESSVFAETIVKSAESSVWGYAANSTFNYSIKATDTQSLFEMWGSSGFGVNAYAKSTETGLFVSGNSNADFASIYVKSGEASMWFADSGGDQMKYANGKLQIWQGASSAGVYIELSDCQGKELGIKEMEICGGQKILVLCSDPF